MTDQLLLFKVSTEPKPIPDVQPLSGRTDPTTSYEAAERFAASGKLGLHHRLVLDGLRRCDGGTHTEIAAATDLHWLQVVRRLPELERMGLIRKGEPRICTVKGSRCVTWWLTSTEHGTGGVNGQ